MSQDCLDEFNGGQDEEEALGLAIELSRAEHSGGSLDRKSEDAGSRSNPQVVDDDDDNDDDGRDDDVNLTAAREPPTNGNSFGSSVMGMDRKAMEQERLARLQKRKREEDTDFDPGNPLFQKAKLNNNPMPLAGRAGSSSKPSIPQPSAQLGGQTLLNSKKHGSVADLEPPFPQGVVKKTWVAGQPRQGDDITIDEVFQKDSLILAMLSSFQWDEDWLLEKIDIRNTRLILVAYAQDEIQKETMRANVPAGRVRFCFPPMPASGGAMHSKLQLLLFPTYLRIVIPTANLMPYDWGETGVMENMVFVIDLPRLTEPNRPETFFAQELAYFLSAQGHDREFVDSLKKYDFTETASYGFVHSIAGSHSPIEDAWKRTGYCGLGRAITALGLNTEASISLDIVSSSIGNLKDSFIRAIYYACQGDSGLKELELRKLSAAKSRAGKHKNAVEPEPATLQEHVRVYYPSEKAIKQSLGGELCAGTITMAQRWWISLTFPRDLFRECQSTRPRILMHNKAIFVTQTGGTAWAYVGSANLSESAWGHLSQDRSSKMFKTTCRNWECGVVIPAKAPGAMPATSAGPNGRSVIDTFRGVMPVPMRLPASSFTEDDDLGLPWLSS